jgi:hypothetical protein
MKDDLRELLLDVQHMMRVVSAAECVSESIHRRGAPTAAEVLELSASTGKWIDYSSRTHAPFYGGEVVSTVTAEE